MESFITKGISNALKYVVTTVKLKFDKITFNVSKF